MRLGDKNTELHEELKARYIELKAILTASGINLSKLAKIICVISQHHSLAVYIK